MKVEMKQISMFYSKKLIVKLCINDFENRHFYLITNPINRYKLCNLLYYKL